MDGRSGVGFSRGAQRRPQLRSHTCLGPDGRRRRLRARLCSPTIVATTSRARLSYGTASSLIRVSATPAVVAENRLRAASRRARPIYSVRVEEALPRRPLAFTYHWLLESSPVAAPGRFDGGWRRDSSKCLAANSLAAAFGASVLILPAIASVVWTLVRQPDYRGSSPLRGVSTGVPASPVVPPHLRAGYFLLPEVAFENALTCKLAHHTRDRTGSFPTRH